MPGMPHLLLVVQPANAAGHRICSPEVPTWTDLWFESIRALYCAQR